MYELHCGDCLVEMNRIADQSIALAFIDIPYGLGIAEWDVKISGLESFAIVRSKLMDGGSIYATCTSHIFDIVKAHMRNARIIPWCKPNLPLRKNLNTWEWSTEFVLWETKGEPRVFNKPDGESGRDYWRIYVENGFLNPDNLSHPARKPIALLKKIIKASSLPGDLILDPFFGSGTTGVAALQTGRNFVGIEKDPEYFRVGEKRMKDAARAAAGLPKQLTGHPTDYAELPMFAAQELA